MGRIYLITSSKLSDTFQGVESPGRSLGFFQTNNKTSFLSDQERKQFAWPHTGKRRQCEPPEHGPLMGEGDMQTCLALWVPLISAGSHALLWRQPWLGWKGSLLPSLYSKRGTNTSRICMLSSRSLLGPCPYNVLRFQQRMAWAAISVTAGFSTIVGIFIWLIKIWDVFLLGKTELFSCCIRCVCFVF